jgi:hypothetical protein
MGRNSQRRRNEKRNKNILTIPPAAITLPQESKANKFLNKVWKYIVGIGILLGIGASIPVIIDYFKTDKQKFEDDHFIQGDLKPDKLTTKYNPGDKKVSEHKIKLSVIPPGDTLPKIHGIYIKNFETANVSITIGDHSTFDDPYYYYAGIDVFRTLRKRACNTSSLTVGVADDRLYVNVVFHDINTGQTIGEIEFNHWKLYKENLYDFYSDDQKLEVIDKQHNIVFSLAYEKSRDANAVIIQGYFMDSEKTMVAVTRSPFLAVGYADIKCFDQKDSDYKVAVLKEIAKIKSLIK